MGEGKGRGVRVWFFFSEVEGPTRTPVAVVTTAV